jgi:hypothetical protein
MKIINWAEIKNPARIPAGETAELCVEVKAGDEDLQVGYVVLLDWEDVNQMDDATRVVPHIFSKAVTEHEELTKKAARIPGLERIIAHQAQRIAELEQYVDSSFGASQ